MIPLVVLAMLISSNLVAQTTPPPSSVDPKKPTMPEPPKEFNGENLDQWIKKLSSKDASARDAALKVIPAFGEPAKKAVKDMVPLINDYDNTVKVSAMLILASLQLDEEAMKTQRTAIISRLRGHIETPSGILRLHACMCIARFGPDAANCIPALSTALKDTTSFEIRKAAAQALGAVGMAETLDKGPSIVAISALTNQLGDSAIAVRVEVLQALVVLGPPIDAKVSAELQRVLLSRLKAENEKALQIWLRVCLMRLDPSLLTEENITFISKLLKDPKLRIAAAEALGYMGKAVKSRLFDLVEGLKSDKPEDLPFVAMCLSAIAGMGTDAKPAIPDLERLAAHKDEFIKANAKQALEYVTGKKKL
jgi:HEAT repeat protein